MSSSESSCTRVVIFRPGIRSTRHPAAWSRPPADRQIQPVSSPYTTKYIYLKYAPRRNWDSPPPLSPASVPLPPEPGGGHTRLRVRDWGVPIPTIGEKLNPLPTLCPTQNSRLFESVRFQARKSRFGIPQVRHGQLMIEMEKKETPAVPRNTIQKKNARTIISD